LEKSPAEHLIQQLHDAELGLGAAQRAVQKYAAARPYGADDIAKLGAADRVQGAVGPLPAWGFKSGGQGFAPIME
jgi:hypothetical protein